MINILILVVSPHVIEFITLPLNRYLQVRAVKNAILQRELNEIIQGPPF